MTSEAEDLPIQDDNVEIEIKPHEITLQLLLNTFVLDSNTIPLVGCDLVSCWHKTITADQLAPLFLQI